MIGKSAYSYTKAADIKYSGFPPFSRCQQRYSRDSLLASWTLVQSVLTEYTMFVTTRHRAFQQAQCYLRPSKSFNLQHQSAFARNLSSLAVLEQREGRLHSASLSAVTAAQKLGGPITGFIAGSHVRSVAEEAAKVTGIEKIIMVENGAYDKVRLFCRGILRLGMVASNLLSGSP